MKKMLLGTLLVMGTMAQAESMPVEEVIVEETVIEVIQIKKATKKNAQLSIFLGLSLGATSEKAPKGFAPIAIGLGLTLIHLISIPVTNTSVNPARSTAVALIARGEVLSHLWIFWIMPIIDAILYKFFIVKKGKITVKKILFLIL